MTWQFEVSWEYMALVFCLEFVVYLLFTYNYLMCPLVLLLGQAEPLLNKVLRLREKVLGDDHVDVAESLINLAVLNNRKVCRERKGRYVFVVIFLMFFQHFTCIFFFSF